MKSSDHVSTPQPTCEYGRRFHPSRLLSTGSVPGSNLGKTYLMQSFQLLLLTPPAREHGLESKNGAAFGSFLPCSALASSLERFSALESTSFCVSKHPRRPRGFLTAGLSSRSSTRSSSRILFSPTHHQTPPKFDCHLAFGSNSRSGATTNNHSSDRTGFLENTSLCSLDFRI